MLIVDITYYTTKQHRCGFECMRRVRTVKHHISCENYSPPPQAYWSKCDNRTCQQSFIASVYEVKNCRCVLSQKVVDKRPCCCLKEEEKQSFCRNGQLEIYTHQMRLENLQCVKSTKKQIVPIICSKAVKLRYGECRPQTCRRPIFLIQSIIDPDTCKCKKQQTVKEERECCCIGKPQEIREYCVGNCKIVVMKMSKFDKINERCVKENFIRRKCPKCPKSHVIEGACNNAGTCLKTNRHISYTIKNCRCQPVEQIRHERCCCPASKQLGSKCIEDKGVIENKNIYYELENGQCIKRETVEEKQITCPKTIQHNKFNANQYCDPSSCKQIVTTYQWNRIGCKCIKQIITTPQICCCTNRIPRTKQICSPNGSYKSITQMWRFDRGKCVKMSVVKKLPPPVCKPQDVTPIGPCDKTTGKQPILITRSIIEECECKTVYREKRDRICACPSPIIQVKPCNPITCLQQTTITKWAIEAKDRKCHRLHPDIKMRPCCCRREVRKDNLLKKCSPTNGQIEITNRTYYFNPKKELCEYKDRKSFINLVCPTETNVVKGKCNLVNGIALDSITSWEKLLSQCKCVKRSNYRKRICSCKHLNEKIQKPICSKQTGMLLKRKKIYKLRNGICQPKVIWMKKLVACSSKKNVDVKCDPATCDQLTTISWFIKIGCKCIKQRKYIKGKCCCPKPVEYRECHRNGSLLIIKKVSYKLNEDKGKCISQTDQLRKDIVCGVHGPRFIKRVCDKETCHLATILLKTVLKNCQCRRMMRKIIHPNIRCCCPNPRFQEKCHQNYGILSRIMYRYELFKKQCITRKFIDENKIVCPEEKIIRGQCDVNTKMRPIQRRFYTLIGCKCQMKMESSMEPCKCRLPVIHKEKCTKRKISRKVWRIVYILRKNDESGKVTCEQEKEYLYDEPCRCRPSKLIKRCRNGNKILMKQVEYLIEKNDKKFCSVRHYMKKIPITCRVDAVRIKDEPCMNNLRRITFMHEILDKQTCECRKQVKVEYEKCKCDKDNNVKESCQNGVRVVDKEIHVFSQSLRRCVKSNVRSVRPVVCSTKHQVIKSSGCVIERPDGIYYSEEIRWEQVVNCRCIIKRRQILRLCGCPKSSIKKQCLDTVNLAIYKNTFINIGGQCIPDQEVITTETRCQEKAQIVDKSTCEKQPVDKFDLSKAPCLETLKISVPTIVNCQCELKTIQIQRRCCTSQPKVKQICDPIKGRLVKITENYVLSPGSILFKRDDLVVYDYIQKATSEQQDQTVVCPQPISYENCDRKNGLLTRVNTYYKRIGCECKPVKEITRAKCGCPPKKQWFSECKEDFRIRQTISYKLINNKCVRQQHIDKQRCGCPKPINRIYCDGDGRWVKCNTQYVYNAKTHVCRLLKHCVRWYDECPKPRNRLASQCNLQTQFKQLIQFVHFVKNRTSCKCNAIVKNEWTEYCGCNHLDREAHRCLNHNTPVVEQVKHVLVKGDCVPKRFKYSTQLNCPKPITQHYPCNNDPNSPDRGYSISKIKYFIAKNCKCIPKQKTLRKQCNCKLIHPQIISKRCYKNNRLLIKKRFSTLMRGKCLQSEAVYKKPINCQPLKRIKVGRCRIGADNIGTQQIDEFHLTVVNCKCKWRITHSERKICKCPDPMKEIKCYNNGHQLMQITNVYSLDGNKCKKSEQLLEIDPCAHVKNTFNRRLLFQIKRCNPVTCLAKRVDYRYFVKNCKCEIQRKITNDICCCSKPITNQSMCNSHTNVIIHKQIHYTLISPTYNTNLFKSYCQPKFSQISVQVNCGKNLQRIRIKPCDGEFHIVTILKPIVENCICKQKVVQKKKIRCGCPTTVRHTPGKCINQWAIHKWIGLKSVPIGVNNSFQITEKSCKPIVMEERRIRCACPPVQVFKNCLNHSLLVIQRVHYKLNKELNNCERYTTKEYKRLVCPNTQITQTPCGNKLENYKQTEVIKQWYANQCKCMVKVIRNKWTCNCHARYPNQMTTKCLPNGYQRLIITKIWYNQGRQCLNRTEKQIENTACPKNLRIIRGQCNSTGHIPLIYLQQRPTRCHCVWQKLTDLELQMLKLKPTEACKCRPKYVVKRCIKGDNNQTAYLFNTYIKYVLQEGECRMHHKFEKIPVVCHVGSRLHRSQCNPINNELIETKITTYLHGCECQQKVLKHRCRCSCPKPKVNTICQSRDGLLRKIKVVHTYKADQCNCEAKYYVQTSRIHCNKPPKLIKIGECHKLPQNESIYVNKNDLYKNVFWVKLRRVGCQCHYKRFMEQIPCYCSPDVQEETQCINDRILEIRRTERRLSDDKKQCVRVVISKIRKSIHLGKPEHTRKCNAKNGIETVVQKLPYVENCKRHYRVNVIHRKCKCNTKPRLIRQSPCSSECKVRSTWLVEKITSDGQCKFYYRVQEKACCCPSEVNLGTFCNRSTGILETGYRHFKLVNGKCLSKDRFTGKQIVCERNEKVVRHQQPNGWIRIEKQFDVRDGCQCIQKLVVDYDKWNCPPPTTQRRCVETNDEHFVLETISTKWQLSESKPVCSRLDTIIDRVPIDCSEEYVNKSDKCVMNVNRHALVRIDQVTTFHADGCRCIENSVRQVFTVCKCIRPHKEKSCHYSKGVLIYQNVHYEVSGDKSRCLPRRSRRVVKITCSPVGPQYKGRTQCDTGTGHFFHLYEELKRVGCQCLKKEFRIPGRCKCPEQRTEMKCSMHNVQQLNTTTYKLSPKGTCIKSDKLQYKYIKCPIADDLLQESINYKIIQSQSLIKHVYKCGSAGMCMRIIQEYKIYTNHKCKCITERKEYKEACCCPTEKDLIRFNLPNNSSQPMILKKQCDSDKGLVLTNTIRWNHEHGKCWPVVHRTVLPVICNRKELFKPMTICRQGQQKHLHQREVREGCKCKLDKRVVMKPCSCDPLGIADIVFLIDETIISRQRNNSYYVNKILKYTTNIFYETSQTSNIDEQFRFALIKYSLQAKLILNLRNYPDLNELYAELKKLTFSGHQSDLRLALNVVKSQILPQIRPGASLIIYLITDAIIDQPTGVKQLTDYLKSHNVQINAILLASEHISHVTLFKQLVSPPAALHLVKLVGNRNQFTSHLNRIADTICKKACPVNHKKRSQCSRRTNCIGRIYNYVYQYNPVKGLCIGKTIVERKQCCCMQEVQRKTTCENNHLIQYTSNWQLTSNGFCEQYVTRRDVTGLAISQCTPSNQTFIKSCNVRGEAVQVTIYRYMENCKCKTKQSDRIVRCRCDKKHNTKTCFGDDLIVYHYHFERLLEGECLPQRREIHKKLACKRPRIFKSPCDSLTCQKRITIVKYVAQRCICKRFVKVKHQTCCCKGNHTSSYAGCKHNDIKVFEEKIFDPKVRAGSCVQRVSYYFQPISCPNKPSITHHSCRRFNVDSAIKQRNYENDNIDPSLIYRLVEKVEWKIQDCDCRRYYKSYFEACGCDESVIMNNSVKIKHECDRKTGVIITYKQKVRLEIVGVPHEYTKLNRLNKLSDAACRPHYVMESARKINKDGRLYRAIKIYKWKQSNCVCQSLPPELIEKQVCKCLPIRVQKKCITLKNKLQIYVIKEKLHKTELSSGKYKYECKKEQTMKEETIQCPKNVLHYSECKEGQMRVSIKVYKINNCKCQEEIRHQQLRCNKREKPKNTKQLQLKSSKNILSTVEQIVDCVDLLPTEHCRKISRSSKRICEKTSKLSDLLCRRTCRRCLGCTMNNIRYQMINTNYPCIQNNNQMMLKKFVIKIISNLFTLASCKLACANHRNCLSFQYSMSNEFNLNDNNKTIQCILYRVDLTTIKHNDYQHKKQQYQSIDFNLHQRFNGFTSFKHTKKCLAFKKICKHTCSSPKLTEISKCECKVYKNYYGNPSESSKFKTSLHCSKLINVQYYVQSDSNVCQEQIWQGYTPCSNPRYRDLSIRNLNNCDNIKSSLWCEAKLADDQLKCKDDLFNRLCSKTCGLCSCHGVNVFNGKCNSTGYKLDTHVIYKSHPIHRICIIQVKKHLSICEYCPIGTFEYVHKCNKHTRSRLVNQITAQLITLPLKHNGKHQTECSLQTKNYKFDCGNCLAAYRDKYTLSSCRKSQIKLPQVKSTYQLTLITEYVVSENGCCRTKRTERIFNCENCPSPRIKLSPCYNQQRLKHIIFYTRPWVTSSIKPNECIQRIITKREKCSVDHHLTKDRCRDSLTYKDCGVFKQSRKCILKSEEARSLCAKTCGFCN
ncbi:von Willebrand factor type A domain-containing [Schistosoma japonicum]|nr:von Willebrand factor type A domain-containing [Schistosoma japonicum]